MWNKVCDKKNKNKKNKNKKNKNKKNKKMNELQFCYLPVSFLGGVYYTPWEYSYLCQHSGTTSKPL